MQKSYSSNYLKIYSWKGLSIILNMFSMFIVVPQLTSRPTVYGIYMLCVSTAIFLSYADIGFVGAGFKYSAEYYAQGDLKNEIKMQGFCSFVLTVFVSLFFLLYLAASFYPGIIIKNLGNQFEIGIASKLLLIQAIFSFTIVIARLNVIAFGIRLENYNLQKILMIGYIIKILSVFYFFRGIHYDIVGYFLFGKIVELVGGSIGFLYIKFKYHYSFRLFLRSFRFSKKIYYKTKQLALGSFYVTIMWILYYELDSVAISKFLGAEALAYFAIGLTITRFFRTMFSVVYTPFVARFNHFVGLKNYEGLRKIYIKVINCTMPLIVFPVISVLILRKSLVLSWVGSDYLVSVNIVLFLVLASIFAFINNPTSIIIKALEKIKQLYLINTIMAITYWLGIFITIKFWQVDSFAIFKFVTLFIAAIFYLIVSLNFLKMSFLQFFKKIILPFVFPASFLIISLLIIEPFLPITKGKLNLLIVVLAGAIFSSLSLFLYYLLSKEFQLNMKNLFTDVFANKSTIEKIRRQVG